MTSHDVRDMLDLPADHASGPRTYKKQKQGGVTGPNLKGLAREVQSLGGNNPIAIVPEANVYRKRRLASRKPAARWELRPFKNTARGDDGRLVLRHWKRKMEPDAPQQGVGNSPNQQQIKTGQRNREDWKELVANRVADTTEDSAFAKFNVIVDVPQYDDEQYRANLKSEDWTKEETDYLLSMAKDFDLRWTLIWDRWDFQPVATSADGFSDDKMAMACQAKARPMEDLKARYYEVAHKMMVAQTPAQYMTGPEFELYETMQKFNPQQERLRKELAISTMARDADETREEESLLLEVKRILARTERFNEERRELYQRLDYPTTEADISPWKSSQGLHNLLTQIMAVDKSKKQRKSLMLSSDSTSPASQIPGNVLSETGGNRRESNSACVGHRDSIIGTPATPSEGLQGGFNKKKGQQQQPERRKLSEQEEQIYGVSYHDRLSSGPTFRYEKINKLFSHKSGQQQTRITNALEELGVPGRLTMPTAAVVSQYEVLWGAVTGLVDLRKVGDRLEMEIKNLEAKKELRAALAGITLSASSAATPKAAQATPQKATGGDGDLVDAMPGPQNSHKPHHDGPVADSSTSPTPAAASATNGASPAGFGTDEDKQQRGSSGLRKRSASVLSAASNKSAKRQKK